MTKSTAKRLESLCFHLLLWIDKIPEHPVASNHTLKEQPHLSESSVWACVSCSLYALKETLHQQNIKQNLTEHTHTHAVCSTRCVCGGFIYRF